MMLRPRQKLFVERSLRALDTHGNTLGVAPTGAGKTIMLSAAVGEHIDGGGAKAAVLAHRDELTAQNLAKFRRVNPGISTSVVDADRKSWAGQVTFAMVPTLTRQTNLAAMPALDLLVIDEAHHAVADSYRRIIDQALHRNPACRIYGVTATPNRGDKIGLGRYLFPERDLARGRWRQGRAAPPAFHR
jgi:superfamily II DNA or RNA helicase